MANDPRHDPTAHAADRTPSITIRGVDLLEGCTDPHAHHRRRSLDVLRPGNRRVARVRFPLLLGLSASSSGCRDVLPAPQVRPQAVPRAFHRSSVHRCADSDRADVPLRTSGGNWAGNEMPLLAMLHPFTRLECCRSIHPSTVVGLAALVLYRTGAAATRLPRNLSGPRKISFFAALFVIFRVAQRPAPRL